MTELSLITAAATGQRVYVAWDGGAHIKIGTSADVARRGGDLRVRPILSLPGGDAEERRFHRMFASSRLPRNREWYWPSDRLMVCLYRLAGSGEPRFDCGDQATAYALLNEIYDGRWEVPAA